jgi:hypothetical protein
VLKVMSHDWCLEAQQSAAPGTVIFFFVGNENRRQTIRSASGATAESRAYFGLGGGGGAIDIRYGTPYITEEHGPRSAVQQRGDGGNEA